MSSGVSVFEYDCEAVRVVARRVNPRSGAEETRKFSVDPNLTSFDILRTILARAFELPGDGDFAISYEAPPAPSSSGCSEWLPLLSDWDLDTAIISAAEPALNLAVTERKFRTLAALEDQERLSLPPEVAAVGSAEGEEKGDEEDDRSSVSLPPGNASVEQRKNSGSSSSSSKQFSSLRHQLEKNFVPSLTSRLQKAKTLAEETWQSRGPQLMGLLDDLSSGPQDHQQDPCDAHGPLTERDVRQYLNKVGEVVAPREMRLAVYQRGLSQHVRKVMWKHLLGVYPVGPGPAGSGSSSGSSGGMDGRDRVRYIKRKSDEYEDLKKTWVDMVLHGKVTDDLKCVTHMVKKDVLRTDRHHPFYSGEGNANVTLLYNILTTYALHHPSVGYCQGMSDLLSPLLVVMQDEGQAYLSFCALMRRMRENFSPTGEAMSRKFEHLSQGILFYDPEFFAYLKLRSADDLLYCYRWLLLEMKREFCFEDACTAMEVLWASLPPPQASSSSNGDFSSSSDGGGGGGVPLFEHRFGRSPQLAPSSQGSPGPSSYSKRETAFTSVVSLRKRLSSMDVNEGSSPSPKVTGGATGSAAAKAALQRRAARSGVAATGGRERIQSDGAAAEEKRARGSAERHAAIKKSSSLLAQARVKSLEKQQQQQQQSDETSSPAAAAPATTPTSSGKKIKSLNEFYRLAPSAAPAKADTKEKEEAKGADPGGEGDNEEAAEAEGKEETPDGDQEVEKEEEEEGGGYAFGNVVSVQVDRLPPPTVFGGGNPFLMFMCLACILQHRDYIMQQQLDYQEIAMHFDRMVRRHNVKRTLIIARKMFAEYLNDDWKRERMGEGEVNRHLHSKNC